MMYVKKERSTKKWLCNGVAAVVTVAMLTLMINLAFSLVYGTSALLVDGDGGAVLLWFLIHAVLFALLSRLEIWMCGNGLKLGCAAVHVDVGNEDMDGIKTAQSLSRAITCCVMMLTLALGSANPESEGLSLSGRIQMMRQADVMSVVMTVENILMYFAWGFAVAVLMVEIIGLVRYKMTLRQLVAKRTR